MKTKVINKEELLRGNKRLCLSTNQVFGTCFRCNGYPKCESKVDSDLTRQYEKLAKKRKEIYKELDKISEEINNL